MHRIRVAVLRGGPSSEYEMSLQTGATVIKHLPAEHYDIQDILITKEGEWYKNGLVTNPHNVISHTDVVFNALHGQFGEDGKIQHILELHGIPFTGSGSFASALGVNKALAKEIFKKEKIRTPMHRVVSQEEAQSEKTMLELFRTFPLPVIVKPAVAGPSVGVSIVKDFISLGKAIAQALDHDDKVIIEEFVHGTQASVGVIDHYREVERYVLPSIEIIPGENREIIPGNFSAQIKKELEEVARQVHHSLGLRHYSRIDFVISPKRGIFVVEATVLPDLTENSLIPKALKVVGAPLTHFLEHVLHLAIDRK